MDVDEILEKDKRIRFAALFDENLKVKEMKMREGVKSLTPDYIDKVVVPILLGIMGNIEKYDGKLLTAGMQYEKVKLFIRRTVGGFIVVSAETDMPFSELANLIK